MAQLDAGRLAILRNAGDGSFSEDAAQDVAGPALSLVTADLDGDGGLDLLGVRASEVLVVRAASRLRSPGRAPHVGLDGGMPDLQVFSDGTVPACVYMHMDRPTRLGLVAQDVDELLDRANVHRVKRLVAGAFDDRGRQIARKGLFTCVECMESRNALDASNSWPKLIELGLGRVASPVVEPAGRPRPAAERSGIRVPLVVVG